MTTERQAKTHWLRSNDSERSPHRLLVVDTETWPLDEGEREVQVLRLWHARLINRHGKEGKEPVEQEFTGSTAEQLRDCVLGVMRSSETLWLYTHNLSYDLAATRLPVLLLKEGFALGRHNLASDAPWGYMKRGSKALRLADSWSWLPVSVERIGAALGVAKAPLPLDHYDEAAYAERCRVDVDIVARALVHVMDEWDRRQLGNWSLTGPSTGWNSMLHMHAGAKGSGWRSMQKDDDQAPTRPSRARTLIDPDPVAREFERAAIYSGRRDTWRTGTLRRGPYVEIDFKTAHLAVCATKALPYRRWRAFDSLALDDWRIGSASASIVARCVVQCDVPRYPLRVTGAVLHPVGQFETTLCGPEITDARSRGELLSVGHGYGYHVAPHMSQWAQWALGELAADRASADELMQIMIKGWSRTVPGRWGMTIAREIASGPSIESEWKLEPALVGTPPRRGFIAHIAGEWTEHVRDTEADDSFPAVLAHIQSWTRLLLGRVLDEIDPADLVSCNTEGFWVRQAALDELVLRAAHSHGAPRKRKVTPDDVGAWVSALCAPLTGRVKAVAQLMRVLSPQHLEIDGERRFAGVPRAAEQIGPERYRFWTWPKMAGQMERGDPRGYVREVRTVDLSALCVPRWQYECGCCEPVEASWSPVGGNTVHEPARSVCRRHRRPLRAVQHEALLRLMRRLDGLSSEA